MNRLVWFSVVLLAAVGVTAPAYRAMFPTDATTRAEPLRERIRHTRPRPLAICRM